MKRKFLILVCAMIAQFSPSRGLTISSPPTFTPASGAPLSGTLDLETDIPSRVMVSVSDGISTWRRSFFDYSTVHSIPLHGFKFSRTNEIIQIEHAVQPPIEVGALTQLAPGNFAHPRHAAHAEDDINGIGQLDADFRQR